jgi:hypothetical protein
LGICATKSIARQKLREFLEREGMNSLKSFRQNTAPGVTFRQQAEWWLAELSSRRSRPVKPATISGWRDALSAWLLANLGDKLLAEVSNKAVPNWSKKWLRQTFPRKQSLIMSRSLSSWSLQR